MKNLYIGKFDLGCENVHLIVKDGDGGEFVTNPDPTIFIGIGTDDWVLVVQTLIHEVTEFLAFRRGARMLPENNMANDAGSCWFVMDHAKFSDICGGLAMFIVQSLPYVRTAWEASQQDKENAKRSKYKAKRSK